MGAVISDPGGFARQGGGDLCLCLSEVLHDLRIITSVCPLIKRASLDGSEETLKVWEIRTVDVETVNDMIVLARRDDAAQALAD